MTSRTEATAGRAGGAADDHDLPPGGNEPDFRCGKLDVPAPGVPAVLRHRVFDILDRAGQHRVTVLRAPAGAGKTMLLASWARANPRRPLAWLSLDEGDNEPEVFWSCLVAALLHGCPEITGDSLAGLQVPAPVEDGFPQRFLQLAARFRSPVVLVLDDVHVLTRPAVLAGLDTVLRHGPPGLRLVLSGRREPSLPLARLRVAGELVDLGFDDLAGNAAEAGELFGLHGVQLAPGDVEELVQRTEGWMSGFRLAELWWAAQPPDRRDVRAFSGDERPVADYLNDEILARQPGDVQDFLLRTCLVDRLTGPLADALTGRQDGARILDELERENALIAPVQPHRFWFRYRPLLRDFLRAELGRRMPQDIPGLHHRAARWHAAQGLTAVAVGHALDAGDWDYAARLLVDEDRGSFTNGEQLIRECEPLLARLPAEPVLASPALATVLAHRALLGADPDAAEPFLRIAEPLPDRRAFGDSVWEEAGQDDLAHRLRYGELRLLQAGLRGRVEQGTLDANAKLLDAVVDATVLPRLRGQLGALAFRYGIGQVWSGQTVAACAAMERALSWLDHDRQRDLRRRALGWQALLNAADGRLSAAEALLTAPAGEYREPRERGEYREPRERGEYRESGDRAGSDLVAIHRRLASALVLLQRDELDDAWALLDPSPLRRDERPAGGDGEPPAAALLLLARALVLVARGAAREARAELPARFGVADPPPALRHGACLVEAEILLAQGDLDRAGGVLDEAVAHSPAPDLAVNAVLRGRLELAQGHQAAALDAVTPVLEGATANTRPADSLQAHLVAAAAHRELGAPTRAGEELEIALALNEPERAVRPFLTLGRGIRSLLTVVIPADGTYAGQRALLLHRFELRTTPGRTSATPARLTPSEAAVLCYLPLHLTNEEIAEDLCLSVNTVKSHLRSLYRKLGVTTRRAAIAHARRLGLLSL